MIKRHLRIALFAISFIMSFNSFGQKPFLVCDLDTNFHFELTVYIEQFRDSTGKLVINSCSFATAIDNIKLTENGSKWEVCDPYQFEYNNINDNLSIYKVIWNDEFQKADTLKLSLRKERFIVIRVKIINHGGEDLNIGKIKDLNSFDLPNTEEIYVEGGSASCTPGITKWKVISNRQKVGLISVTSPCNVPKLLKEIKKFKGLSHIIIGMKI